MSMQLLTTIMFSTLKVERSLGESITYELKEIAKSIGDFFVMLKEMTYDALVDKFGDFSVNLLGMGLIIALVIFICMAFINR